MDPFLQMQIGELHRQDMLDAAAELRIARQAPGYRSPRRRLGALLIFLGELLDGRPAWEQPGARPEAADQAKLLAFSIPAGKASSR